MINTSHEEDFIIKTAKDLRKEVSYKNLTFEVKDTLGALVDIIRNLDVQLAKQLHVVDNLEADIDDLRCDVTQLTEELEKAKK